jgi:hypothetical protein
MRRLVKTVAQSIKSKTTYAWARNQKLLELRELIKTIYGAVFIKNYMNSFPYLRKLI